MALDRGYKRPARPAVSRTPVRPPPRLPARQPARPPARLQSPREQEKAPVRQARPAPAKYTAKAGDNLNTIADKFELKNSDVIKANPNVYKVNPGQTINLPKNAPGEREGWTKLESAGQPSTPPPWWERALASLFPNQYQPYAGGRMGGWSNPMQFINQMPNPLPYFYSAGLTKYGVSPAALGMQSPSYTRPSYWTQGTGWRDVGASGREGRVTGAASDWRREWTADDIEKLRRMGYGGRMLAEGIEGRAGSPNMKPLYQTYADYAVVPDYPDYVDEGGGGGGGGWDDWGYDGDGGGGGGGGETAWTPSQSGPSWSYSPAGYTMGNFSYSTLGLVNWRI